MDKMSNSYKSQRMKEVKSAIESTSNRIDHAEERISELEDRNFEITQRTKKNRAKKADWFYQPLSKEWVSEHRNFRRRGQKV